MLHQDHVWILHHQPWFASAILSQSHGSLLYLITLKLTLVHVQLIHLHPFTRHVATLNTLNYPDQIHINPSAVPFQHLLANLRPQLLNLPSKMAKDKDRTLNPAATHRKQEKQKALKKGTPPPHLPIPSLRPSPSPPQPPLSLPSPPPSPSPTNPLPPSPNRQSRPRRLPHRPPRNPQSHPPRAPDRRPQILYRSPKPARYKAAPGSGGWVGEGEEGEGGEAGFGASGG